MSVILGLPMMTFPDERRIAAFRCSRRVVSDMMNTKRRRHAQNEHFYGPHWLCRDLDLVPKPRGQVAALKAAGCTMIRTETGSGKSIENWPELGIILDFIHPGETLVVTRIDRLACSMKNLQAIVTRLREGGANIAATEQPVDTSTAAGNRQGLP